MDKRDQEKKRKTSSGNLNTNVDLPTGPPSDGVNPGPNPGTPEDWASLHGQGSSGGGHGSPYTGGDVLNGEKYVLDGDRMVKKSLVDKYGIDNLPPAERMANSFERSDFGNRVAAARQQASDAAKTTATGFDSESERALRQQWANEIGVNEKSDENQDDPAFVAKQQLVDLIKGGHYDKMPDGNFFTYHGNGIWEFKDRNGMPIPANSNLVAQATKAQDEKTARYAGTPVAPVAPPAPTTPLTGPTTDIFSGVRPTKPPLGPPVQSSDENTPAKQPPVLNAPPTIFPINPNPSPLIKPTIQSNNASQSIGTTPTIFPKPMVTPSIVSAPSAGIVDRKTAPIGGSTVSGAPATTPQGPLNSNPSIFNALRKPRQPLGY